MDIFIILGVPLCMAASFLLFRFFLVRGHSFKRRDIIRSGGISTLEEVTLGGVRHLITIQAASPDLPVLLVIHGGADLLLFGAGCVDKTEWIGSLNAAELVEQFTVVFWNQKNSAVEEVCDGQADSMNWEQILKDANELSDVLRSRFGTEKIVLCGLSWGTITGLWLAQRYPEKYYGYFGVSQVVNWGRSYILTYDRFLKDVAAYDALSAVRRLEIPVHFVQGRDDRVLPAELLQQFYDDLISPRGKGLSWLKHTCPMTLTESSTVEQELLAFARAIGVAGAEKREAWMFMMEPARR